MEINEQKRQKFMENASKRVNNVMHNIQILEPMARSNTYDFTREDVEEMFLAMQETLDSTKAEFIKKLEGTSKVERKSFAFGQTNVINTLENKVTNSVANVIDNVAENASEESVVENKDNITE
jgi:light-regulated signal transduction histidine kinase (bacteriophytochrome)